MPYWGEEEIQQQLDSATRSIKRIAARLSTLLLEDCSPRTGVQCRKKIKKLKSDYKNSKNNNVKSSQGRTSYTFYSHAVLGCRLATAPRSVVDKLAAVEEENSKAVKVVISGSVLEVTTSGSLAEDGSEEEQLPEGYDKFSLLIVVSLLLYSNVFCFR